MVLCRRLITAAHFESLPLWFRLLSRWRREAVRLLTKPRKTQARRQSHSGSGRRVFALAAARHAKSSPLISAQDQTQSDVKDQENPGQACGDRLHFPGVQAPGDWSRKVQQSDDPSQDYPGQVSNYRLHFPQTQKRHFLHGYYWMHSRNASSSSGRNESHNPKVQASGDCSQKKIRHDSLLFLGANLVPNMSWKSS